MQILELLVLPLVISSVLVGVASLGGEAGKKAGTLGTNVVIFYSTTTILAVVFALILVMAIKPGETEGKAPGSSSSTLQWSATLPESHGGPAELGYVMLGSTASTDEGGNYNGTGDGTVDALLGVLLKAFPVNIVDAAANKNFLGIVVFSASFGLAAAASPRGAALLAFFDSVNEAVLLLVHTAMWYAPFGIASLIIGNLGATDDLPMELKRLYIYILTVLAGLATHAFVFLPAIYFALLRRNPYKLMRDTSQAILTGLGTASSAATLPVSMSVVQKAAGVSARAAKLVMPLGVSLGCAPCQRVGRRQ